MAIILGIAGLAFLYFIGQMALAFDEKMARLKTERAAKAQKPEAPKAKVNTPSPPPAKPKPPPFHPPTNPKPPPLRTSRAVGQGKAETQYTVTELLRRIQILQSGNAGWEMIFEQLVPNNDAETKRLLNLLRGPHMFIPHVGLNVLEEECRTIAAHAPRADWIAAFRAAAKTMERLR